LGAISPSTGWRHPRRKDLPIQLAKTETDEVGRYGDPKGKKIVGIQAGAIILPMRIHQWRIMNLSRHNEQEADYQELLKAATAADVHTHARGSARRVDGGGEAALEFCQ